MLDSEPQNRKLTVPEIVAAAPSGRLTHARAAPDDAMVIPLVGPATLPAVAADPDPVPTAVLRIPS
jgi:hypothetical protein